LQRQQGIEFLLVGRVGLFQTAGNGRFEIGTARNLGLNTHQLLCQLCREGLQRRAMTPLPLDQDPPSLPKAS